MIKMIDEGHSIIGIDNFDSFYDRKAKENNLSWLKSKKSFSFHEIDINNRDRLFNLTETFDVVIHLTAKAGIRP